MGLASRFSLYPFNPEHLFRSPASFPGFISYQHSLLSLTTPFIQAASSTAVRASLEQETNAWLCQRLEEKERNEEALFSADGRARQAPESAKSLLPKTLTRNKWTELSDRNNVSGKQYKWSRRKDRVRQERGPSTWGKKKSHVLESGLQEATLKGGERVGPVWLVWKKGGNVGAD